MKPGAYKLLAAACIAGAAWLTACTQAPTPYGPLQGGGGYQESRLQERMYRVTFQGNPATRPGDVLDMALLRCAELARDAGYAGFALMGRSAEAKVESTQRAVPDDSMFPGRHTIFALPRYETVTYVRYHEVTLLMRMLPADEVKSTAKAFDATDLLARLEKYRARGKQP